MRKRRSYAWLLVVMGLVCAPGANAKTLPLSPDEGIAQAFAKPSSALGAVADTTAVGIALGLLDYGGLHHLDHPVAQKNHGIYGIAKTPLSRLS